MKSQLFLLILLFGCSAAVAQFRTRAQQQIFTNEDSLNAGTATNKTVISGYGSVAYQRDFNQKVSTATLERAVLFVGHQFNAKISFFSEMASLRMEPILFTLKNFPAIAAYVLV